MSTRKKKSGRPRKPAKKLKSTAIRFRLTDREKALIEKAAEADDLGMSAWIRRVVVQRARKVLG